MVSSILLEDFNGLYNDRHTRSGSSAARSIKSNSKKDYGIPLYFTPLFHKLVKEVQRKTILSNIGFTKEEYTVTPERIHDCLNYFRIFLSTCAIMMLNDVYGLFLYLTVVVLSIELHYMEYFFK